MKIGVFADADSVAREAAAIIAAEARASVAAHGRFIAAFSGGHTPWLMLRAPADETVPWAGVHVAQVDERVAPAGDPDRNLTYLRERPVLQVTDRDVGVTGIYQGRRRMTLTYPILNRSRRVLWIVTGSEKTQMLVRLHQGDQTIPTGRVRQDRGLGAC
jgi:6-phosphogluconolactonase